MPNHFDEIPITLGTNPFTGREDGDDTGYRDVSVSPLDEENPDPLVIVNGSLRVHPVYAIGKTRSLCPYYGKGLGASLVVLLRKPVLEKLLIANELLLEYGLELVVLDGFRPWWVQTALWRYLRSIVIQSEGLTEGMLSLHDQIRVGLLADNIGSYCAILKDSAFYDAKHDLLTGTNQEVIANASERLEIAPHCVAELYLTFNANLRRGNLFVDKDAPTAHGSGGAVDLWMRHKGTGQFCNLGVPFDYVSESPVTRMDYFDHEGVSPKDYKETISREPILYQHLQELGFGNRIEKAFYVAQRKRRILFHAMMQVGASFYSGECWHFQPDNKEGGNQAHGELEGSGNVCHALLKGKSAAVWGNTAAHALAAKIPEFR